MVEGFDNSLDHSLQHDFEQWLKQHEGRELINFLERVFNEASHWQQTQAAKVILHLLSWADTPEADAFPECVQALQSFSQRQDIFSGGPLGEESLRAVIRSVVEIIVDNVHSIEDALNLSPWPDPTRARQESDLIDFRAALSDSVDSLEFASMQELETENATMTNIMLANVPNTAIIANGTTATHVITRMKAGKRLPRALLLSLGPVSMCMVCIGTSPVDPSVELSGS